MNERCCRVRILSSTIAIFALVASRSWAAALPLDLSNFVSSDLTKYTGGYNYPQHGGPLIVGGIPFTLSVDSSGDTSVIWVGSDEVLPIGVRGVSAVYTLINSAWGHCGTSIGELDFVGTSETYVYTLTEGLNVRDHFNDGNCNSATAVAGTANFGPDRLDMQKITLPAPLASDTLVRIEARSYGKVQPAGNPIIAAVTLADVSCVPGTRRCVVPTAISTPLPLPSR